jgi:hypothetical protein
VTHTSARRSITLAAALALLASALVLGTAAAEPGSTDAPAADGATLGSDGDEVSAQVRDCWYLDDADSSPAIILATPSTDIWFLE